MRNTYFYERLNNKQTVETYIEKINTYELEFAKVLLGNIYLEANDHPRFPILLRAYQKRLQDEQHKKE